jgi:signal transduction histidine kinase
MKSMADLLASPLEPLFESIFEHASEALAVLDDAGKIVRANRAARALAGPSLASLLGDGHLRDFLAQLASCGHAATTVRSSGTFAQPQRFEIEGRVQGAHRILAIRDVTAADAMEAELDQLRRVESFGVLTASIVHDFNNLLTPIVCLSSLLSNSLVEGTSAARMAKEVRDASQQAAGLSRQLLRAARRESSLPPERVDVNAVMSEMRVLVELIAGDAIDVVLELDASCGDVIVERERLEHVIFNLAANARDAMPHGGTLTLQTEDVREDLSTKITVTDTGTGMSTEVRDQAFDRFFTTKAVGRGTGLGLASAHRFATRNKGRISIQSQLGTGTNVVMHIPTAPAEGLEVDDAAGPSTARVSTA